jgi:cytoskeletal protein CcmA (bactofilin family)
VIEPLLISFDVASRADHAFETWTSKIDTWWPSAHTTSAEPDVVIVLEGELGGRLFERTNAGIEHEWGQTIYVAPGYTGLIYASADFGGTWAARPAPLGEYPAIAVSSDGREIYALTESILWKSNDGGDTWIELATGNINFGGLFHRYGQLATSADGRATLLGGRDLKVGSAHGVVWATPPVSAGSISATSVSASGDIQVAANGNTLLTSIDSGENWAEQVLPESGYGWQTVQLSSDGSRFIAATNGGPLYVGTIPTSVVADKYVALGDSYQSGEGTFNYVSGTDSPGVNLCHRSLSAYPGLLVSSGVVQLNLDFRACSGATIATMVTGATSTSGPPWNEGSAQVSSLGITTKLVTVGIVGNDLQFATTVHDCIVNTITSVALPIFSKSCQQNQGADVNARLTSLKSGPIHDNLLDLYRLIRAKAPYARVIVVSYPHFFPKTGAANCGWVLRRSDQVWFNNGIDRADDIVGQAAREAGFEYVNMNTSNAGHEQCTDQEAMNGVTPNLAAAAPESCHTNELGHQLMEARLATKIGQTITPSFVILPQKTVQKIFTVAGKRFAVNVSWPGSDVETTLISPSGVRYTRDDARDAAHDHGQTWEYYDIANPEQGDWTIEMYGKRVSANGEPVTYGASTEPTPNQPPTAVMNVTGGGNTYSFDASASSDSDGTITDYMWDFGDGEVAFGPTATHTYAHAGSYAAALVTTDDGGAQGFATSTQTLDALGLSSAVLDGATTLTNNIAIHGATAINGNFECNSNAAVTGTVTVHGNAHLTNLCHVAGDLIVAGDVTLDSTPTVDGSVRATGQVALQSTVHIGHDLNGSAVISMDGKDDAYLTSHGVVGGTITRVAATVPAATPYSAFVYNPADWNGSTIKTWTAWMNQVAAANAAPSWSQGLTSSPGCVMAPWGSSVNGPSATITGNTVIDARQATSGCAGVALQQMNVTLAGDLTIVADKFSSTNGLTFTSSDGQAHTVRVLIPGSSACNSGRDVSLQAGTVSGDNVRLDVTAPGSLTVNGTSSISGNVNAGCFSSSGTVTVGHD